MNKLPLLVCLVLAGVFALMFVQGRDTSYTSSAMVGKPMPAFALEGLASADIQGHAAVLNVFASWCASCVVEHPVLRSMVEQEQVPLYGLAYKDMPEKTAAWLQKHGNIYRKTGQDSDGRVAIEFGVYGVPETFVIDAEGVIRYRQAGPVTEEIYRQEIQPLLKRIQQ